MQRRIIRISITILISLFALSTYTRAQWKDNMGGNWNNPTSASLGNIINDRLWNRMRAKARARKNGATSSDNSAETQSAAARPEPAKPAANAASLKYRPASAASKARALADELGSTAEEKQQYLAIMEGILNGYNDEAAKAGHANDISAALAFFMLANTTVYHAAPDSTDAQFEDLRQMVADTLLEADAMNGVSDRQKQEMAETLILYTGLAGWGYQQAKETGDAASAKIYRQLAGQNLQTVLKISPDRITLGPDGLKVEGGPETAGPPPSAADTNVSAASSNSSAIYYTELAREYYDNEVGAQARYDGKRILVAGRVHSVRNDKGKIQVHFIDPMAITIPVNCYFPASQAAILGKLKLNDEIVVIGTVHGSIYSGIILDDCVLK
jgi:hypothetical protein